MGIRTAMACAAALALSALAPGVAQAGLLGSTVNVSAYFPDIVSIYENPGNAVVTNDVEYLSGAYDIYNTSWEVDVQDNRITITDVLGIGLPFSGADFNGFVLRVISGPAITSASINNSSTIVPVNAQVSGGSLFINLAGVGQQPFGTAIIDVSTAGGVVPEPGTWALMLIGFGGLGAVLRRRRLAAA